MPGPVMRIAPNPRRRTGRSPPIVHVSSAGGDDSSSLIASPSEHLCLIGVPLRYRRHPARESEPPSAPRRVGPGPPPAIRRRRPPSLHLAAAASARARFAKHLEAARPARNPTLSRVAGGRAGLRVPAVGGPWPGRLLFACLPVSGIARRNSPARGVEAAPPPRP